MSSISSSLEAERKNKDMTQDELARLVDVTRQTIIAIEKGNYSPSVELALRLSKILGISVEDLFKINE